MKDQRMPVDPSLLEIHTCTDEGFHPQVDFAGWRVAVLNYIEHLRPENLKDMQRHDETDEVFVLLKGRCILFLGDGDEEAGAIHAVDMAPHTIYNVKRGTWHNHTLSEDASVLVVENLGTTVENSPFCGLTAEQTAGIVADTRRLWGLG
jgi:hypothetical protein